jgi:hypothetical protein
LSLPSLRRYFAALFIAAFVLNWLWEMLQMPAYGDLAGRLWSEMLLTCTVSALGDATVTLSVYAAGALVTWNWRWALKGGWRVYLFAALVGALLAVGIEWAARSTMRWSYSERMPQVLSMGLWPLLQLTLLVPAAFRLALWWHGRMAGQR